MVRTYDTPTPVPLSGSLHNVGKIRDVNHTGYVTTSNSTSPPLISSHKLPSASRIGSVNMAALSEGNLYTLSQYSKPPQIYHSSRGNTNLC